MTNSNKYNNIIRIYNSTDKILFEYSYLFFCVKEMNNDESKNSKNTLRLQEYPTNVFVVIHPRPSARWQ